MRHLLLFSFILGSFLAKGQDFSIAINRFNSKIEAFQDSINRLSQKADSLKLIRIQYGLEEMGVPSTTGEIVRHSAMTLSYNEVYEMANWVAHVITTDIAGGGVTRTNDFRTDSLIETGTAVARDYFIHRVTKDGKDEYEGFGYDRGHLAPSADFRWNQKALSESYFYSNITPQAPDFNRESWVNLESALRTYVIANNVNLFVVTGPILSADLEKIEKSPNGVAIPNYHFKVALDTLNDREIGFIMPNAYCKKPLEAYAFSIDSVEALTGLNFFKNYRPEKTVALESKVNTAPWLSGGDNSAVKILSPEVLGKNRYNTIQAYDFMNSNKKVEICGTVVRTFKSKKNNIFLDIDKAFPNSIFSVSIWSRDISNFSYDPIATLKSKKVCFYGIVKRRNESLQMNVSSEKQVTFLDPEI